MQITNLLFLLKDNQVCLGMKKRRFGTGKWNGVGGKVLPGENVIECLVREAKEEIDVEINPQDLTEVGIIHFSFEDKPEWNQVSHVYTLRKWKGEPTESEELRPQWYDFDKLPFESMWVDDKYWLPQVLEGKKVKAQFHFINEGAGIGHHKVEVVA